MVPAGGCPEGACTGKEWVKPQIYKPLPWHSYEYGQMAKPRRRRACAFQPFPPMKTTPYRSTSVSVGCFKPIASNAFERVCALHSMGRTTRFQKPYHHLNCRVPLQASTCLQSTVQYFVLYAPCYNLRDGTRIQRPTVMFQIVCNAD